MWVEAGGAGPGLGQRGWVEVGCGGSVLSLVLASFVLIGVMFRPVKMYRAIKKMIQFN